MELINYIAEVVTPATFQAVTLAQAKKQNEISTTDATHDDQLNDLIRSATDEVQRDTGLYLCRQTVRVKTDEICDGMQLQGHPIISITSIKYYDASNVQQTLATSVYNFDTAHRRIYLKYTQVWPVAIARWDAWEITYLVGYADQDSVPQLAKKACLQLIANDFYDRGDMIKESEQHKYERTINKLRRGTYP